MKLGVEKHRYWRVYKTNSALGGFYHNELEVFENATDVTPTATANYSQSGLNFISFSNIYDNNLATPSFYTDSAGIGSTFTIDFGAGNEYNLTKWRFYVNGNVTAIWDVEYSDDGITWTTAAVGLDCSGGAGWKEITW